MLHMLECYSLGQVPFEAAAIAESLVTLAAKAETTTPGASSPFRNFADAEIDLVLRASGRLAQTASYHCGPRSAGRALYGMGGVTLNGGRGV